MNSKKSGMLNTCAPSLKMVAMAPVVFKAACALHMGARAFAPCTISENEKQELLEKLNQFSCRVSLWRNGFGRKSISRETVGSGQHVYLPVKAMDCSISKARIVRRIEWLMKCLSAQFPKGYNLTTYAAIESASTPPIWSLSPITKTCFGEKASKRKTPVRHTVFGATHFQEITSKSTKERVDVLAESVFAKVTARASNVFDKNKQSKVEPVPVSAPAATGTGSAT